MRSSDAWAIAALTFYEVGWLLAAAIAAWLFFCVLFLEINGMRR